MFSITTFNSSEVIVNILSFTFLFLPLIVNVAFSLEYNSLFRFLLTALYIFLAAFLDTVLLPTNSSSSPRYSFITFQPTY